MKNIENIALIGFMGSGKTTVGKLLAERLNKQHIDSDDYIQILTKMTVTQIFEKLGEKAFRNYEKQMCEKIIFEQNVILSSGGGFVKQEYIMNLLKTNFKIVYLIATPQKIFDNLKNDDSRPLLNTKNKLETIKNLLSQRLSLYEKFSDFSVNTNLLSAKEVCDKIILDLNL